MSRLHGSIAVVGLLAWAGLVAASRGEDHGEGSRPNSARTKDKGRDAEPRVLTQAEAERRRSEFLPGRQGRYGPGEPDWRSLPPWRQTSFFGLRAEGRFFVYVVDCSGSMLDEGRLVRAKQELRRSILDLREPQRFAVIFYNDRILPQPGDLPRPADGPSKDQLRRWLRLIEPDGETDPRGAMGLALSLRPDAVFLLTDGEYASGTAEAIARKNPRKVPIHCIDLAGGGANPILQQIARDSGGRYASRPQQGGLP
jgi:hypothetical protein